jgi:type VI secretion system protein VasD
MMPVKALVVAFAAIVGGCASLSPYSTQTRVELELLGGDQLNPDINGRPSPVVVRLVELNNPVVFATADFFSLYGQPKVLLAPDLIASEELELRPGERMALKLRVRESSRYVGVLAAYRDLPETQWRYVIKLNPGQTRSVRLVLDHAGIQDVANEFGQVESR